MVWLREEDALSGTVLLRRASWYHAAALTGPSSGLTDAASLVWDKPAGPSVWASDA